MKLIVRTSNDGSHTLYREDIDETYHSTHGAIQEAIHVFIEHGLSHVAQNKKEIKLLEMGFGTGLNAFLTAEFAKNNQVKVDYTGYELYPVPKEVCDSLNYANSFHDCSKEMFRTLHQSEWEESHEISNFFSFRKVKECIMSVEPNSEYDLIYFDAFGPRAEPTLWEPDVLNHMGKVLKQGGVLATYCAKGQVRRDLISAGFEVERLPGPPGKREMLRATKL